MPSRSRQPVDVMRRYLEAMQSGDRERAFGFLADDIVLHVPGRSPYAGERRGRHEVIEYIHAALAHTDDVEVTLIDMLVSDRHVALIVQERLEGGGRVLDMRRTNVYRVQNERIAEVWIFESDQYAVDDYLAGAAVK
jgi:ketosteroid isomerase-like protein